MFIEPTNIRVPSGFLGIIWLDIKILLKKCKSFVEEFEINYL